MAAISADLGAPFIGSLAEARKNTSADNSDAFVSSFLPCAPSTCLLKHHLVYLHRLQPYVYSFLPSVETCSGLKRQTTCLTVYSTSSGLEDVRHAAPSCTPCLSPIWSVGRTCPGTVHRIGRDVVKADDWSGKLRDFEAKERMCDAIVGTLDAARASQHQDSLATSLDTLQSNTAELAAAQEKTLAQITNLGSLATNQEWLTAL